jgi:replicative DNA helicase
VEGSTDGGGPAQIVLRRLAPHHLHDQRLADVLTAVAAVMQRGQQPDIHLVRGQLVRALGPQQTHDIDTLLLELHREVPLPASVYAYCTDVLGAAWRRRVAEAGTRLTQAASSSNDDDLHELVRDELTAIGRAHQEYQQALLRPSAHPTSTTVAAAAREQEPTA